MSTLPPELEELKHLINLVIHIEGPSSWIVRGLIENVDEYVLDTISLILDENLSEDLEYEILEDKTLCDISPGEKDCKDTLPIAIYFNGDVDPLAYIVFNRKLGDNTYIFKLRKIILTKYHV